MSSGLESGVRVMGWEQVRTRLNAGRWGKEMLRVIAEFIKRSLVGSLHDVGFSHRHGVIAAKQMSEDLLRAQHVAYLSIVRM